MGEVAPDPIPSAPEKLTPAHDLDSFHSDVPALDDWLRRHALQNEGTGASRTYVISLGREVIGYYSLSAGSILSATAPGRIRRNMPEPIPVMLLGRLAVDRAWQGKGFGKGLLRDAVLRTIHVAQTAGIRAILVHAISEQAKHFYKSCGFQQSPVDSMTLLVTLDDARSHLGL